MATRTKVNRSSLVLGVALTLGCGDLTAPLAPPPQATLAATEASDPSLAVTHVPIRHVAFDPCVGELVDVSGTLRLQVLAELLEGGRYKIRWVVEATDVTGRTRSGDERYRFTGASSGESTLEHRDRLVTSADFLSIALGSPGVDVHRPNVTPRMEATLSLTPPVQGPLEGVEVEAVGFGQKCPTS